MNKKEGALKLPVDFAFENWLQAHFWSSTIVLQLPQEYNAVMFHTTQEKFFTRTRNAFGSQMKGNF